MIEPLNRFGESIDTLRSSFLLRLQRIKSFSYRRLPIKKNIKTESRNTPPHRL